MLGRRSAAVIALFSIASCLVVAVSPASDAGGQTPKAERHLLSRAGVGKYVSEAVVPKFDDEFTGPAGSAPNPALWAYQTGGGGWGNNELESYTTRTANASLDGAGHLAIRAYKETYVGHDGISRQYTSARIQTKKSVMYGTLSARILLPTGQGLWPAFWTVGQDETTHGWPVCGEIDVMEALNQMQTVIGTVHGPDGVQPWTAYGLGGQVSSPAGYGAAWHTYSVNWQPNAITWAVDGKAYRTILKSDLSKNDLWEVNKPQILRLNLAIGGWPGNPDASTFAKGPKTMLVDWVRATA